MLQRLLTMKNGGVSSKKENSTEFFKIFGEYSRVIDVLISCKTPDQIQITENMFNSFRKKWGNVIAPLKCEVLDEMILYIDRDFRDQVSLIKNNLSDTL